MNYPLLAKRYARALLEAALELSMADEVSTALDRFVSILEQQPRLQTLLSHPLLPLENKAQVIKELIGEKPALFFQFVLLVLRKRATLSFRQLKEQFELLFRASRGGVEAELVSATALDPEQKQRLQDALKSLLKKDISLRQRVDPLLIGGMLIKVGDELWDGSLHSRLVALKETLTRN